MKLPSVDEVNKAPVSKLRTWFIEWPEGPKHPHTAAWKRVLERLLEEKLITDHRKALIKCCIDDCNRELAAI